MKKNNLVEIVLISLYAVFVVISFVTGYSPGKQIAGNFIGFSKDIIFILPCAFVLIGLFEVWVSKETVEKHMGHSSRFSGYIWAILLSGTTIGGFIVALPVAQSLYRKGAKLSVVFVYLAASAICRVPMAIFEASFLGVKFTVIRFAVSIPLIIVSSILLAAFLERRGKSDSLFVIDGQ